MAFNGCDTFTESGIVYYTGAKKNYQQFVSEWDWSSNLQVINISPETDFLGFTFNGYHSFYDLNILRTSDGDRFNMDLTPKLKEITADNPGNDGQYYFGTYHTSRNFSVKIAFDSLTEKQLRQLKQVFSSREVHDLIFDEEPYKVWSAKVTGTPSISCIPFDGPNNTRVYKGEGTIQFVCYWPYAHTPDENTILFPRYLHSNTYSFGEDGRAESSYDEWLYPTRQQWASAGVLNTTQLVGIGENYGDVPTHFTLSLEGAIENGTTFEVGDAYVTLLVDCRDVVWNSKTGIVSGLVGSETTPRPLPVVGSSAGTIPVEGALGRILVR